MYAGQKRRRTGRSTKAPRVKGRALSYDNSLSISNKARQWSYSTGNIFRTVQTVDQGTISQAALVVAGFAWSFKFGDLDQASSFGVIFDQYRITKVECKFMPLQNALGASAISSYSPGTILTVIDFDDANTPTAAAQLRQYQSCKEDPSYKVVTRYVNRPHIATSAYAGAFGAYANQVGTWIDSTSTNVQHYGVKALIQPANVAGQTNLASWQVVFRYWMEFKNTH